MRRCLIILLLAGCPGRTPTSAPIHNATANGETDEQIPCDDEVVGPLYMLPDSSYLISEGELAQRTIREHRGDLLRCYTERTRTRPSLYGRVTVDFMIDAEGRAREIRTRGFDAIVDRCICERIAHFQFDKRAFDARVSVPLDFANGS
jgi:hypothetical protein